MFKEFQGAHLSVDYPEAIYDAWISFEERWGDAAELENAVFRVRKLMEALTEKRSKVKSTGRYIYVVTLMYFLGIRMPTGHHVTNLKSSKALQQ